MRFIHAADIHLDSPLVGLATYPDAPAARLRTATREALSKLVDEAIEQRVDFLVIAGDLYDGNWRDFNTGIFFAKEMGRLQKAHIPVFVVHGNHDAASEQTRTIHLPDNVRVFSSRKAQTCELPELEVALHGRSFKDAATTENLVHGYPPPRPGWFNIGVLHTALEGSSEHANYAPCSIAELEALGYDYWALGHVHEHRIVPARTPIVFPGNLQGRHARELGPRGAVIVTTDGARVVDIARLLVAVLRWEHVEVRVDAANDVTDAMAAATHELERLLVRAPGDMPLAVRMTFRGATPAHAALHALHPNLRDHVIAVAASVAPERLWLEKVLLATTPERMSAAVSDGLLSLVTDLHAAKDDPALRARVAEELNAMSKSLPSDLHASGLVPDLLALPDDVASLIDASIPGLLARLGAAQAGTP